MFDWIDNGWDFIAACFGIAMVLAAVGMAVALIRDKK